MPNFGHVMMPVLGGSGAIPSEIYRVRWHLGLKHYCFAATSRGLGRCHCNPLCVSTSDVSPQVLVRWLRWLSEGKIIADRGYNMRNYVRGSGGGPRALESVEWDPKSPNLSSASRPCTDD